MTRCAGGWAQGRLDAWVTRIVRVHFPRMGGRAFYGVRAGGLRNDT